MIICSYKIGNFRAEITNSMREDKKMCTPDTCQALQFSLTVELIVFDSTFLYLNAIKQKKLNNKTSPLDRWQCFNVKQLPRGRVKSALKANNENCECIRQIFSYVPNNII